MRHPVRATLILLAALVAANATPVSDSKTPFSISINVDDPIVKAGADVPVVERLTNTTKRTMRDAFGCQYEVSHNSTPLTMITRVAEIGSGRGPTPPFAPGETRAYTTVVSHPYDMSHPGIYTIQLTCSENPVGGDIVKSNIVTVNVLDQEHMPPFKLAAEVGVGEGVFKSGARVVVGIGKINTSTHDEDCTMNHNRTTGLDESYQWDVRDGSGNSVAKRAVDHLKPDEWNFGPCTMKPAEGHLSDFNEVTRLYDLSKPGKYTIQVSQPVSDNPYYTVIKSNILTITVTK